MLPISVLFSNLFIVTSSFEYNHYFHHGKIKKDNSTKQTFDTSSSSLMTTLRKHVLDWFENHCGEEFISSMIFQQTYPQFDKYDQASFQIASYAVKKKIMIGE